MQNLSNYDKKRISNIVWTITGKYGYDIDFSLLKEDYFNYLTCFFHYTTEHHREDSQRYREEHIF